ncbi:ERAP1-like C-terminal domain-containing protein, partial [Nocardioides sp.]|uniref:ERAP1-like C-terminal domain-containing protein n=1 Tax=Nocardioides sp. TaxID=35761 RepID=UPI003562E8C2
LLGWVVPLASEGALARLHASALESVRAAVRGSELQLSAFRAVLSTAQDATALERWAAGQDLPQGLDPDLDLRWRALVGLAAQGAIDLERLDAELAAEPTNDARVSHARAHASLPNPQAKAWAWSCFTGEVEVGNYELAAAGAGLWRRGQDHVNGQYVDRYFDELPGTVQVRSGWMLADAAEAFFPHTSLTAETLERAQRLAADENLDLSLRRRLLDEADDLQHLLAIQRAFPKR